MRQERGVATTARLASHSGGISVAIWFMASMSSGEKPSIIEFGSGLKKKPRESTVSKPASPMSCRRPASE